MRFSTKLFFVLLFFVSCVSAQVMHHSADSEAGDVNYTIVNNSIDSYLTGYDFGATQPNIDGSNVTTGTIPDVRIDVSISRDAETNSSIEAYFTGVDYCGETSGCGYSGGATQPIIHWSNITNVPAGVLAVQPNIHWGNVSSVPASVLAEQPVLHWDNLTDVPASVLADSPSVDWFNVSNVPASVLAVQPIIHWSNVSNVPAGVLAVQPNIDGANVTSGTVLNARIDLAIARAGLCPDGEFVVNTTSTGVECEPAVVVTTYYPMIS